MDGFPLATQLVALRMNYDGCRIGACENITTIKAVVFSSETDDIFLSLFLIWSHLHVTENMDCMPDDNSRYKDVDYWDERYKTEQCYDWLGSFSRFQPLLEEHVKKEDAILILG